MKTVFKIKIAVVVAALFSAPILANAAEVILPGGGSCASYSYIVNKIFNRKKVVVSSDLELNQWYSHVITENKSLVSHYLVDPIRQGSRFETQNGIEQPGVRVDQACAQITPVIKIGPPVLNTTYVVACVDANICKLRPGDQMQDLVDNARCLEGGSDIEQQKYCRSDEFRQRIREIPPTEWLDARDWPRK